MNTLHHLFEYQLNDLYSAESQILDVLPKMVTNATNDKLKKSFENHFEKTITHQKRLEEICRMLHIFLTPKKNSIMQGLISDAEYFMMEFTDKDLRDVVLISEAQRMQHYEISGYGTAVRYAKELGHDSIAITLQTTLNEEYHCEELLADMAEERLNLKAMERF